MFTGVDIIAILLVVMFILYLARPDGGEFKLDIDPLALLIVLVTVAMFLIAL